MRRFSKKDICPNETGNVDDSRFDEKSSNFKLAKAPIVLGRDPSNSFDPRFNSSNVSNRNEGIVPERRL
jgi:hypothetical protein